MTQQQEKDFIDIARREIRGFTWGRAYTLIGCTLSVMATVIFCTFKVTSTLNRFYEIDKAVTYQGGEIKTNSGRITKLEISDATQNAILKIKNTNE